jgi:hypothetical protein
MAGTNMNEKLKTILRNAWSEPRHFFFWLLLLCCLGLAVYACLGAVSPGYSSSRVARAATMVAVECLVLGALVGLLGFILAWIPPVRRLLSRVLNRRFFVLACLVTLVALLYAEENWRGKRAWETFKSEYEAEGVRFDLARLAPPPVPDDRNFAMTPIVASTYEQLVDRNGRPLVTPYTNVVNRLEMPAEAHLSELKPPKPGNWQTGSPNDMAAWQSYYREVAAVTNLFSVPTHPQTAAADVLLALRKYDAPLDELRRAARRPESRFPVDYDAANPVTPLLPHLGAIRGCVRTLQLRASAELELGQTAKALEDVQLILYLANSVRNEPFLISQLVHIAVVNAALQPVWEGCVEHRWTDKQLAEIERGLGRLNCLENYRLGIRGEEACATRIVDLVRRTRNIGVLNDSTNSAASTGLLLLPAGWFYQNELHAVRFMEQWYVPLADTEQQTVSPAAFRRVEAAFQSEVKHATPFNLLERLQVGGLSGAIRRFAMAQADVDLARVGCALERYRLAHDGQYPETLEVLVPEFIDPLPHDVINGGPLHYRRTDDGRFLLYSVGWNETDDGGHLAVSKAGRREIDKGDWVWPAAAKE